MHITKIKKTVKKKKKKKKKQKFLNYSDGPNLAGSP